MPEAIRIKNLSKIYGKERGIENINLKIEKGEVFGFIGPNGAGKSTTIKCIMNLINKNSGEIFINGEECNKKSNKQREFIGYLPAEINLYEDLTVRKMFEYSASFYKKDCKKKIAELVEKLDVDTSKKIDELSLGNLKKVGIVLALMHSPQIVIMDEATSGLDPLMQEKFYEIIEAEKQKGTTIFFSSHILSEIKRTCDKVAIIKDGKIEKVDKVENLTDSNFVKVTVVSENIKEIIDELKMPLIFQDVKKIEFMYQDDIDGLINILHKYKITKVLINEPSIEDVFMHYYK